MNDGDAAAAAAGSVPPHTFSRIVDGVQSEAPPLLPALTTGVATGDLHPLSSGAFPGASVDDSSSTAAPWSHHSFMECGALAMQYFTALERTLPGESFVNRSPDLDSGEGDGLEREVSQSFSGCASYNSAGGYEHHTSQTASRTVPCVDSNDSFAPTADRVATAPVEAGCIDSAEANHVPLTAKGFHSEVERPPLASQRLASINVTDAVPPAVRWMDLSAVDRAASPLPLLQHSSVTRAQVVWKADRLSADDHLPRGVSTTSSLQPSHFPVDCTRSAFPFLAGTHDTACSSSAAAAAASTAQRVSTISPSLMHASLSAQACSWSAALSVNSAAGQGIGDPASMLDGRYRWPPPSMARVLYATRGNVAEGQLEAWEDNIFDEGGALLGSEMCLWLLRHVAACWRFLIRWLRRFLTNWSLCAMVLSPVDSASESDGYEGGRETDDSTEWDAGVQSSGTRATTRSLGVWSGRTVHLCRPLLSGSPCMFHEPLQLHRDSVVHLPLLTSESNPAGSGSSNGAEVRCADRAGLSLLSPSAIVSPAQLAVGAIPGVSQGGFRDGSVDRRHLSEGTSTTTVLPLLRRVCVGGYAAVSRTVVYYNVFVSQRAQEARTFNASVPNAAYPHIMPGSQATPPLPAEHTVALSSTSAMPPSSRVTGPHSLSQPFLFDVGCVGQVFVLLQYLGLVLLTATVVLLGVFSFHHLRDMNVEDATACNRYPFEDRVRPDWSFSLICFVLNSVLAVRYAVRAVRYEKGGPLVVQGVVVVLQVCRAVYFLLVVTPHYIHAPARPALSSTPHFLAALIGGMHGSTSVISSAGWHSHASEGASGRATDAPQVMPDLQPLLTFTRVSIVTSVSLFVGASVLSPCVYASFGWRRYALGIVQVSLSRVRHRLTVLRTCVQLDGAITMNAYLATVFLLDSWSAQRTLLLMTSVIFGLHYVLIPLLRRSRHWWPLLCAGGVLVIVSSYYTALIVQTLRNDRRLRSMSNSPWYSKCYLDQLPRCLHDGSYPFSISIFRDTLGAGCGNLYRSYTPLRRAPRQSTSAGASQRAVVPSSTHGVCPSLVSRDLHPSARETSPFHAVTLTSRSASPLFSVNNATDTYLPTHGAFLDYFRIHGCNATCFADREESSHHFFERHIAGCCADYGQCRLKDAYRTYAVLLLVVLMTLSFAVRIVLLVVAWRRWAEKDDLAIELFVQEHCRRHHRSNLFPRRLRRCERRLFHDRCTAVAMGVGDGPSCLLPHGLHASQGAPASADLLPRPPKTPPLVHPTSSLA